MNIKRTDIEFKVRGGIKLRGWFYTPQNVKGRLPAIVMAHGFSATKDMSLPAYAETFAEAGMAVLVYDNRNLGTSEGTPRFHIDPLEQVNDYRDAISFVSTLPEVDKDRIGVWGTSYSGGHVMMLGAIDRRIKCIVSQVPLTYGRDIVRRLVRADQRPVQIAALNAERQSLYEGGEHTIIPVCDSPYAAFADIKEVSDYFLSFKNTPWENKLTLSSIEKLGEYYPAAYIRDISPTPIMFVVQKGDTLTAADLVLEVYHQALEPKRLELLEGGHFDVYTTHLFKSAQLARDWFTEHLITKQAAVAQPVKHEIELLN